MKQALVVATVFRFLNFEKSDIEILQSMGYEVHAATNMREAKWLRDDGIFDGNPIIRHQIDFGRTPFSKLNLRAYRQIKELLNTYNFNIIHCHTPVAAAITRVAARTFRRKGTYVIYTSHGFHFHKESGLKNWILYYPIESFLARWTDMIITINREDFSVIRKFKVKEKRYIPGVGVDVEHIHNVKTNREKLLREWGIPDNAFVILSIGELSERKNQSVIIRALGDINNDKIYYILCGTGEKQAELQRLAREKGIEDRIIFTGQKDHEYVIRLCHAADLGAIPSVIEGLGLAGIEMLAAGTPLIGSGVHGIKDYLIDGETGIACDPYDSSDFRDAIIRLMWDREELETYRKNAYKTAKRFDINRSKKMMKKNYESVERRK